MAKILGCKIPVLSDPQTLFLHNSVACSPSRAMTLYIFFSAGKVRRGQTMPENDALVQVVKMHPEILQQMLSTVLNIIMFEDCRNQWSMSRPLLGLILLNEDYFQSLRDQVFKSFNWQSFISEISDFLGFFRFY